MSYFIAWKYSVPFANFYPGQIAADPVKAHKKLQALQDGVYQLSYCISNCRHVVSIIKEGTDLLLWDPNSGVMELTNPEDIKNAFGYYGNITRKGPARLTRVWA